MSEINILESNLSTLLKGDKGDTPNISLGEVTILEKDQNPTVTISGTELDRKVNFGLPSTLYPWTVERLSEKLDTTAFNGFLTTFQSTMELLATKEELSGQRADLVANIEGVATTLNGKIDTKLNELTFTAFLATLPNFDTFALKSEIPTIPTTWDWDNITNKPNLFSGDYNDLTNKPEIPTIPSFKTINGESIIGDGNIQIQGGGGVTSWNDLTDKPTIPTIYWWDMNYKVPYLDIRQAKPFYDATWMNNMGINLTARDAEGNFKFSYNLLSNHAYTYMKAEWEAYTNNHVPTLPDNIATTDMIPDVSGFATKDEVLTNSDGEVIAQSLNELNERVNSVNERVNGIVVPDTSNLVSVDTFNNAMDNVVSVETFNNAMDNVVSVETFNSTIGDIENILASI